MGAIRRSRVVDDDVEADERPDRLPDARLGPGAYSYFERSAKTRPRIALLETR